MENSTGESYIIKVANHVIFIPSQLLYDIFAKCEWMDAGLTIIYTPRFCKAKISGKQATRIITSKEKEDLK